MKFRIIEFISMFLRRISMWISISVGIRVKPENTEDKHAELECPEEKDTGKDS